MDKHIKNNNKPDSPVREASLTTALPITTTNPIKKKIKQQQQKQ